MGLMSANAKTNQPSVNRRYCSDKLTVSYAHVGLYDVQDHQLWIARKRWGNLPPIQVSHARLLQGGSNLTSVADKDKFVCYWMHTPNTGDGLLQGYPIEWDEGHIMIRLDPTWNYATRQLIPSTDTAKVEKNIDQQYRWAEHIFKQYIALKPNFPISWHLMGPRPADSMFYVQRHEP